MALPVATGESEGVLQETDPLTLECGDCGARSDIPGEQAASMLANLRAFLAEHTECSYDVSLVVLPAQRSKPSADG